MFGQAMNFLIVHWAIIVPIVLIVALVFSKACRAGATFAMRMIARPLLLAAVVAIVYDGTRTLAGGSGIVFTSLAEHWQASHPASLAALKTVLSQVHPLVWEKGAQLVLKLPTWSVIGTLGLILAWIGRKRRQPRVFVN